MIAKRAVVFARNGRKASAKKLTPGQRAERARKAAQARWAKAMNANAPSKQRRDRNAE